MELLAWFGQGLMIEWLSSEPIYPGLHPYVKHEVQEGIDNSNLVVPGTVALTLHF